MIKSVLPQVWILPSVAMAFAFATLLHTSHSKADPISGTSIENSQDTWSMIRSKTRVRTFSEYMTPGLKDNPTAVPDTDGSQLMATNMFNIFWTDYEFAQDTKVVYWQRFSVNFAATPISQGVDAVARNPRFALRRVNVIKVPHLDTTYDVYIQPGLASEASRDHRNMEFGFRTNTSYQVPQSRFSFGTITELTFSIANQPVSKGSNLYGWVMPWVSYELNKTLSTQHYATLGYLHERGSSGLQLDKPMPFVQNGLGANLTKSIWVAGFVNNYVTTTPTLKNTWASLWLSMNVL